MALTTEEHERVATAIRRAEARTSGEIFCVFTEYADDLKIVPVAYAALAALCLPPILLILGIIDPAWFAGWRAESSLSVAFVASVYAALSALIFALVFLLCWPLPVRFALAPRTLRHSQADRLANENFLAHGIHTTKGQTGVLIFLSRRDHFAEIIADEGIYERVEPDIWGDALDGMLERARTGAVTDAFLFAVEACGRILTEHFPADDKNPNELPDRLVEL